MTQMLTRFARLGCVFWTTVLAGCGAPYSGPDAGPLLPVEGVVTYNGKPVPNGEVEFGPDEEDTKRPAARGVLQKDGRYTLETEGRRGATAGRYRVVVVPDDPKEPGARVDALYMSWDNTPLRVEVSAKPPPGNYDLKLTTPSKSAGKANKR